MSDYRKCAHCKGRGQVLAIAKPKGRAPIGRTVPCPHCRPDESPFDRNGKWRGDPAAGAAKDGAS